MKLQIKFHVEKFFKETSNLSEEKEWKSSTVMFLHNKTFFFCFFSPISFCRLYRMFTVFHMTDRLKSIDIYIYVRFWKTTLKNSNRLRHLVRSVVKVIANGYSSVSNMVLYVLIFPWLKNKWVDLSIIKRKQLFSRILHNAYGERKSIESNGTFNDVPDMFG